MKKFIAPILVIIGFFSLMYAVLASTDRTTTIALVGAGYSALLVVIYFLILAIKNPNFVLEDRLGIHCSCASRRRYRNTSYGDSFIRSS